jgi:uncharacterized protein (DUF433 family)/GNAT superfamily N-acetyltransferase
MAQTVSPTYVGVGLYTISEAARIVGVKSADLRQWLRDYTYSVRGVEYRRRPFVERTLPEDPNIVTFLELIELLFIKLFRSQGVSMRLIRAAAERAAERWGTDYPFAVKRFDTDGKYIFATLQNDSGEPIALEELSRGQLALDRVIRPFFRKLDYEGNADALRFWPMERDGRVVLDPHRQFGQPIDAETGVPTRVLFAAVKANEAESLRAIADWYEVPIAAVEAAVEYERSLLAA